MGHVFSFLAGSNRPPSDIFIDFENAAAKDPHSEAHAAVRSTIAEGQSILQSVQSYGKGARAHVGDALASKDMSKKISAFTLALPFIERIAAFSDFAQSLSNMVPGLVDELTAADDLEHQQALAKMLADVLSFVVQFDAAKLMAPSIQNDFSFYRRMYSKMIVVEEVAPKMKVTDDEANMISMFIAQPTPMIVSMATTLRSMGSRKSGDILTLLATMANILCSVVMCEKFDRAETNEYCMRAMVGAMVLYDHLDSSSHGAFGPKSRVKTKQCCKLVRGRVEFCNMLKYSTKHFNMCSDKVRAYLSQAPTHTHG
jgi:hypothetical protein